jgi:hypothetical protein
MSSGHSKASGINPAHRPCRTNSFTPINQALEQTRVLVVLATSPEDLRSGWVEYEWRSFLNEVLSGRKPEGQIFTLLSGVRVAELPYALRSRQMVPLSLLSPHDALECLRRFINPVFARPQTH